MKHFCERESFKRKREYDPEVYREYKYEVWDNRAQGDEEDDGGECVFKSDSEVECQEYLLRCGTELRENGVCKVCDLYDRRQADLKDGKVRPYYLVSYSISRQYGGPEEGGWWYDWTSINEVRRAFTLEEGVRQARTLKDEYPQPRYNRFSCANRGEGDNHMVLCYGEDDPRWPTESTQRPRYE